MECTMDYSAETKTKYSRSTLPFSYRALGGLSPSTAGGQQLRPLRPSEKYARTSDFAAAITGATATRWARRGCLIVDLGRMNRILEVDESLGATRSSSPASAKAQLYEYLREDASRRWMDANGAGPDASSSAISSSVASATRRSASGRAICAGMEVVLGTGRGSRDGLWPFSRRQNRDILPARHRPRLDGLFFQSSYGIVTRLAILAHAEAGSIRRFLFRGARGKRSRPPRRQNSKAESPRRDSKLRPPRQSAPCSDEPHPLPVGQSLGASGPSTKQCWAAGRARPKSARGTEAAACTGRRPSSRRL